MKSKNWSMKSLIFMATALMIPMGSSAQIAEKREVKDGWQLQEAAIVIQEAKQEGWYKENSANQTVEGEVLSKVSYPGNGWYKATVPGTVLTTLVDNGIYPEPTYGENNRPEIIPDMYNKDWWYRVVTTIPAQYAGRRIWLNFEGINYESEVWVNGRKVGVQKGAFTRANMDITRYVEAGQQAAIAVHIWPQHTPGISFEHTLGTTGGPCGGRARLDGPTFGCSNGWDWLSGVRDRETGIWQGVFLYATGDVVVGDPLIKTDLPLPRIDEADIVMNTSFQNRSDRQITGIIRAAFEGVKVEKEVTIAPYQTLHYTLTPEEFPELRVKNPRLWWPNGLGAPELYRLHLAFVENGKESDAQDLTFGIREFEYQSAEGSDRLALKVNGVRVFCKGGNWGMDEMLKRLSPERLEAAVRLHRDANYNMIRNWGGQSTSNIIYELCDKYGMLFWDEFFQFNSADPVDMDLYMANCRDKVLRYRNHPSIVIWCARNEAYPPQYQDDALRFLLKELDPDRWYQSNSGGGYGCNSGGPYEWQSISDYYNFSQLRQFNKNETFKTEIAAMAIPTLESLQGMMNRNDWMSITDAWAEHNYISGGGRKQLKILSERFGKPVNVADFIRKSQMMNFESNRALYEGRMGEMFRPCEGVLLWMSMPAQPSFVWQIFHYDLEPHAGFFGIKSACEPIHVMLNEAGKGKLQVINHLPAVLRGVSVSMKVYNLDGTLVGQKVYKTTVEPTATTDVCPLDIPTNTSKYHFVKLELRDTNGKILSENFYWRASSPQEKDFTELDKMPKVKLNATATAQNKDGRTIVTVTLKNNTNHVALMTHLQLHRAKSLERVLPAYYSDNYLSLAPKEQKVFTIEADAAHLKGDKPMVLVDGWNVSVGKSAMVAENKNASVDNYEKWDFGFIQPEPMVEKEVHLNVAGYNFGNFRKEPGFLEGAEGIVVESIDMSAVENDNPAPARVYGTVRWGECAYRFRMSQPAGTTYKLRLHFAELDRNTVEGRRVFNVAVNDRIVLSDIDVAKEAGAPFKAIIKEVEGIKADANGEIVVAFKKGKSGTPQATAIEIIPENVPK